MIAEGRDADLRCRERLHDQYQMSHAFPSFFKRQAAHVILSGARAAREAKDLLFC
jgi:hypothetical protein